LARLLTDTLRDLDAHVELSRQNPHRVAADRLRTQALTPGRQGAP
jgi:glycine betaine/choline ABC-type transport system substrate-binding protein